jgi:hypothetical protein
MQTSKTMADSASYILSTAIPQRSGGTPAMATRAMCSRTPENPPRTREGTNCTRISNRNAATIKATPRKIASSCRKDQLRLMDKTDTGSARDVPASHGSFRRMELKGGWNKNT